MDTWEKRGNHQHSNEHPSLIYLNSEIGSVFDSQVIRLLKAFSSTETFSKITLLCGVRNEQEQRKVEKSLAGTKIGYAFFKSYPNYPFFNFRQQKSILKALKSLDLNEGSIIHIRGELLASQALKPLQKLSVNLNRVVVDIRGAAYEELTIYFKITPLKKWLKQLNFKLAFKRLGSYKKLSAVSSALKDYLLVKTTLKESNIRVIHCLAADDFNYNENRRNLTRELLGLTQTDKLLVFSSGGAAGWQNMDSLKELISHKWTLLNLSKNQIEEHGVISKYVPYHEVPNYLNAADAAIIFRDKNVVNEVACPVKFCEYVASGLPVISNDGVKIIVEFLDNTKTGILVNHPKEIHSIDLVKIILVNREELAQKAKEKFGENEIANCYISFFFNTL